MNLVRATALSVALASCTLLAAPPAAGAKDARERCGECIGRVITRYLAKTGGRLTDGNGQIRKPLDRRLKRRCARTPACKKALPDMSSGE